MTANPLAPLPIHVRATAILDYDHPRVREWLGGPDGAPARTAVVRLHARIRGEIHPIYDLDDRSPVSRTLARGKGSCSQRMALLEAAARASGVPTRVRALWIDGRFWYPRFLVTRPFIPSRVLLAWPQFHIDGAWLDFDRLHDVPAGAPTFDNDGETLYDAVRDTRIDLDRFIVADEGVYDTRDELVARHGSLADTWRGRAFRLIYGGRKSA